MVSTPLPTAPVVVVTARSFSSGKLALVEELQRAGCEVVVGSADHPLPELTPLLARATAWIAGTGRISAAHFEAAPQLRILARHGVGTDAVDLAAAAAHGVVVTNTPGANTDAVADHAVALMLAALRDVVTGDRAVRAGDWTVRRTRGLADLTIGIVGLGRIGRAVAARVSGFGSARLGHDPFASAAALEGSGVALVELDELVRASDIITLHAPGDSVVIDGRLLELLRPETILVNTARARLVDEVAVAAALRAGRLRCYATDVLDAAVGHPADHPLLAPDLADRTLFTPHSAAQTVQAVDLMGRGAVDAVLAQLRGEAPPNEVRLPDDGGTP